MSYFLDENFLLQNEAARTLYHEYAREMPVIDYHCHLPPQAIAENTPFENLTDCWLRGDHYKWRAMRTLGIPEQYITGGADDREKFRQWAAAVPYTMRNPLYHWTHMELKDPFGVKELLDNTSADRVYDTCNALLQQPDYTPRGLLKHFRVKVVVTTDDPCDDLSCHKRIAADGFGVKVLPGFRPDKVLRLQGGTAFREYIVRLSDVSGVRISGLDTLLEALSVRVDYFHANNCRISDHGLNYIPLFNEQRRAEVDVLFGKVLGGHDEGAHKLADDFAGYVLYELSKLYHRKGWVQQFHLGALRNNNSRMERTLGPDTGFDSIGDERQAGGLSRFFDRLDATDQLCKTILYNLNPAYNEVFATMTGNFNDGSTRGKMQFGSGWWYLDQQDGMEKQLNTLSNMGLLSCFVGMLTDSRSFLSYSRHDYFRRVLCNLIGQDVSRGLLPGDIPWLGQLVQDISYNNAKQYFPFNL